MLFSIRYENDEKVKELQSYISNNFGLSEDLIKVIDNMVLYSGKAVRRGNLFKEA